MKQKTFPALVLAFFLLVMGTTSGTAQDVASNTGLLDSPSTTQATACTERNGSSCPEWVHKLIGRYPPLPESQQLPPYRDPSSVHFWTYRRWQEPPLRSNKEVFRSKLFVAAHIGGAIAMIVACRSRNSGEDWGSEVPAVAAVFAMDYIQFRLVGGPNAIAPPIYEMIHYGRASTK